MRDLVIQEQFLECCPRSLQVYIKERGVDDLEEIASYAATYTDAHGRSFQDYFTIKVCSVGKSDRRSDVTQENPLRLSEWGLKI